LNDPASPEQLGLGVAEAAARRGAGEHDPPAQVDDERDVVGVLQQRGQPRLVGGHLALGRDLGV
jgi:hypothetical protein